MGNLRASYKKDNGVLKIVQLSDYDAFGYEHYRNTIFSGNTPQQYRYQNQLKIDDFDIGWDMFKFRASDNQLGRFFSVDPKADQREWLSPYNYAANNPINRIDPDGALDDIIINSHTRQLTTIKTDDKFDRVVVDGTFRGNTEKAKRSSNTIFK